MSLGWLGPAYDWVKALHVIAVVFWLAGMFMLPRFLAYHAECDVGSEEDRAWQERERRLLRIIINPSMLAVWSLGLALASHLGFGAGWLQLKILLVLALSGLHGRLVGHIKAFARGQNRHSSRYFRILNEAPALISIAIIILVIVKPF